MCLKKNVTWIRTKEETLPPAAALVGHRREAEKRRIFVARAAVPGRIKYLPSTATQTRW